MGARRGVVPRYARGKKEKGAGYAKILKYYAVAMRDGYKWVFIDTCCIDKKSSADLMEAINAMFRWHKQSHVCYAYLSDIGIVRDENGRAHWPTFERGNWFTRGWALQELIAPSELLFYDNHWQLIGTRLRLLKEITAATAIPGGAFQDLHPYGVAQKMSWASERHTSRVEDVAYCLLGLLNVQMPLLYGEGSSAFLRLQHEIIKNTDEETLFAWGPKGPR